MVRALVCETRDVSSNLSIHPSMKENDRVRIKHCHRSQYMNTDFLAFIDEKKDKSFVVERIVNGAVKLRKVGFWITEEFLEVI